jgi:hypothetical protein
MHDYGQVHNVLPAFFREKIKQLVLEPDPQITFPEDHHYNANPGIVVKFKTDIGYLEDEQAYRNIFKF